MVTTIWRLLFASTMGLAACAPLPRTFPRESAANPRSAAAPAARVTRALEADPPLPGEAAEGWSALDDVPRVLEAEEPHPHAH
jgi:hypothetical protein